MGPLTDSPFKGILGLSSILNLGGGGILSQPTERQPHLSELLYFHTNPHVGGMASSDNRVVMNPYSGLSDTERRAVADNEQYRLRMRESGINPSFDLTDQQSAMFRGSPYQADPVAAKHSILARILSGDPSANATPEQISYANFLRQLWTSR